MIKNLKLRQALEEEMVMGSQQKGKKFRICYPISANQRIQKHPKEWKNPLKVLLIVLENKKFLAKIRIWPMRLFSLVKVKGDAGS